MKNKGGRALSAVIIMALIIAGVITAYFYFNLPEPCIDCGQNATNISNIPEECADCLAELPQGYQDLGGAWVYRDLVYSSESTSNLLDLYIPKQYSKKMPVIVYIHGGAFKAGDKNPALYVKQFTDAGYAFASINYRLSGEAQFPAAVNDVKSAVRWLRANSNKYNLDKNNFGAMGGSAGGYFASMLGLTGDIKTFDVGDNLEYESSVKAVIDMYGPVNFQTLAGDRASAGAKEDTSESAYIGCDISTCQTASEASPVSYISSGDAAFLILHGSSDSTIPIKQSQDFYNALKNAGINAEFITVEGAGHGGQQFDRYVSKMIGFFDGWLK